VLESDESDDVLWDSAFLVLFLSFGLRPGMRGSDGLDGLRRLFRDDALLVVEGWSSSL